MRKDKFKIEFVDNKMSARMYVAIGLGLALISALLAAYVASHLLISIL